ncbi:hypothetical protein AgCh_023220 [Apium graveolens]
MCLVWRGIKSAKELIEEGSRIKVGNGTSINIWNDPWIPETDNAYLTTSRLQELFNVTVSNLLKDEAKEWDRDLIHDLFNDEDARRILKIPLSMRYEDDLWFWTEDEKGKYTIKSGYRLLCRTFNQNMVRGSNFYWIKLWALPIPPKMKSSENIGEFVTRLKTVTNEIKRNEESLDDVRVMEKLLRSLIRKFDYVVTSIEESKDLSTISIDELVVLDVAVLYVAEVAIVVAIVVDEDEEGGLSTEARILKVINHLVVVRILEAEDKADINNEVEERSHFAAAKEDKDIGTAMFLTYKEDEKSKKNVWYLDSGVSNHMTGHKELFTEIDDTISGEVTFGDSSKIPVKGKGTITIMSKKGEKKYINDVYYIPALKNNIISLGQLVEKGYNIQMQDNSLIIRNQARELIANVEMSKNHLFTLDMQTNV